MSVLKIVVLAVIQGLAELLPVSSSAHVVVAEKLMGLDPSAPDLTLLLVLLHTGTMAAVIVYFWRDWRAAYFSGRMAFTRFAGHVVLATLLTAAIGLGIAKGLEHTLLQARPGADVEDLFSHLELIWPALFVVGVLIICADRLRPGVAKRDLSVTQAGLIGIVQGLCLPFSFALAVVLTPAVIAREVWRFERHGFTGAALQSALGTSVLGGAGLRCRIAGVEVDQPLARVRSLVSFRDLLFDCGGGCCSPALGGILMIGPYLPGM